jgi:hypothetical protein
MATYEEYIEAAEKELGMAAQVTEQKGASYYFQRAQVLAMLAMAAAEGKGK